VIEAFVPDLGRFSGQQTVRAVSLSENEVRLDASQLDPVNQQVTSQQIVLTEAGIRLYPAKLRYAWPSELDLMAQLAGLQLKERWENWHKVPFSANSGKHISVYGHAR